MKRILNTFQKIRDSIFGKELSNADILSNKLKQIESDLSKTQSEIDKEEKLKTRQQELRGKKELLENLRREKKLKKLELKELAKQNAKARIEEQKSKRNKEKPDLKKWQDNAFLRGKAAWNDMYGSVVERNRKYFAACILLSIALLASISSLAYMSSQSKIQPYIVQVGRNGDIVDVSSANKAPDITENIVKYFLQQFIINIRSISGDNIVEKNMLAKVYASVNIANNNNAMGMVKSYIQGNNPFVLNSQFTNQINIESIFPVSKDTYQISWEENKRSTDGRLISKTYYTGQLSYKLSPSTPENYKFNPFGIYITNITWSQVQIEESAKPSNKEA